MLLYRVGDATLRNARAHSLQSVLVTRRISRSAKPRPAFQQRDKNLIPVVPRCGFDRHVIGLILLMDFERLAKSHFGRDFAVAVAHSLAMLFEKFRELGLRDAEV